MRWEDERYVRLYIRDTTTWKLLPWQSKALLPLILRKLDRVGIIDLGEDGYDGIAAVTDMPRELVDIGMPELLRRGVFKLSGSLLIAPKFIEAQEAVASQKLRSEVHRERVKIRNESLQNATKRDDPSRGETGSQAASRGGTPSCADPCCAEPDQIDPGFASPAPVGPDVPAEAPPARESVRRPKTRAPSMTPVPSPDHVELGSTLAVSAPESAAAKLAAVIARVHAVYIAGRLANGRKAVKINPMGTKLVTARINEGCTEEDLCAAARGIWIDDGLRGSTAREFHHAMRDTNIAALGILDAGGPPINQSNKLHERALDPLVDVPRPKPIAI